jgi:hypothetical protein
MGLWPLHNPKQTLGVFQKARIAFQVNEGIDLKEDSFYSAYTINLLQVFNNYRLIGANRMDKITHATGADQKVEAPIAAEESTLNSSISPLHFPKTQKHAI